MKLRSVVLAVALSSACNLATEVFFFQPEERGGQVSGTSFLSGASWGQIEEGDLMRYGTLMAPLLPETDYFPCITVSEAPLSQFQQLFFQQGDALVQVAGEDGCFEVITTNNSSVVRREKLSLQFQVSNLLPGEEVVLEYQADETTCALANDNEEVRCALGIIEAGATSTFRLLRRIDASFLYLKGLAVDVVRAPWPNQEEAFLACENPDSSYQFLFSQAGEVSCSSL